MAERPFDKLTPMQKFKTQASKGEINLSNSFGYCENCAFHKLKSGVKGSNCDLILEGLEFCDLDASKFSKHFQGDCTPLQKFDFIQSSSTEPIDKTKLPFFPHYMIKNFEKRDS